MRAAGAAQSAAPRDSARSRRRPPWRRPRPRADDAGRRRLFERTGLSRTRRGGGRRARPAEVRAASVAGAPGAAPCARPCPRTALRPRAKGLPVGGASARPPGVASARLIAAAPGCRLCSSHRRGEWRGPGGGARCPPPSHCRDGGGHGPRRGPLGRSTAASRSFLAPRSYFWKGKGPRYPPRGSPTSCTSGPRVASVSGPLGGDSLYPLRLWS